MSGLDLSRIASAQRIYDSEAPKGQEWEEWISTVSRPAVTDDQVDQFIAEFGERGFYLDELGNRKTEELYCAVAKQYSRSSAGSEVGPVLFKWAKACVSLGYGF